MCLVISKQKWRLNNIYNSSESNFFQLLNAIAKSSAIANRWTLSLLMIAVCVGCPATEAPEIAKPVQTPQVEVAEAKASGMPIAEPPIANSPIVAAPIFEPSTALSADTSVALESFLKRFDRISDQGFVPTLRSGSTGIGYTLETMLQIEENNSPGGDYLGMELKAFRDDDLRMDDSEKMNLFLKEPQWIDGLKGKQRVPAYGYVDSRGRPALYSTVTINENAHKLAFRIDDDGQRVWMTFDGRDVAFWTKQILAKRLREKHTEAVFVSAHPRGKGKSESFHYYGVTWCSDPSVDSFIKLIEENAVMLELRMHLKDSGSLRNHGSAFRIKQNRIPDLYRVTKQVRP